MTKVTGSSQEANHGSRGHEVHLRTLLKRIVPHAGCLLSFSRPVYWFTCWASVEGKLWFGDSFLGLEFQNEVGQKGKQQQPRLDQFKRQSSRAQESWNHFARGTRHAAQFLPSNTSKAFQGPDKADDVTAFQIKQIQMFQGYPYPRTSEPSILSFICL